MTYSGLSTVTNSVLFFSLLSTDDNVGFVLGAVGSLSALVTMGVMIKLHNRKQDRWVTHDSPHRKINSFTPLVFPNAI